MAPTYVKSFSGLNASFLNRCSLKNSSALSADMMV